MSIQSDASFLILMAEDDADDLLLTSEVLADSRELHVLKYVEDGLELIECLRSQGSCANNPRAAELPVATRSC